MSVHEKIQHTYYCFTSFSLNAHYIFLWGYDLKKRCFVTSQEIHQTVMFVNKITFAALKVLLYRRPNIKTSYRAIFQKMTFLHHENLYIQAHFLSKARISTILGNDEIRHVLNCSNFIGLKSQRSKPRI